MLDFNPRIDRSLKCPVHQVTADNVKEFPVMEETLRRKGIELTFLPIYDRVECIGGKN